MRLRSIRSGASSRFLIFRSPEFWAPRSELVVFNFLFGFLPLCGALAGFSIVGTEALRHVVDPRDPLHRLTRPLDAAEQRRGVVRVSGRLRGGPVCLVVHERRNDKSWNEDWRETLGSAEIETAEAGAPRVAVAWWLARWEPDLVVRESPRAASLRALSSSGGLRPIPAGGRVREGCVAEGQPIFVEGCESNDLAPRASRSISRCGSDPIIVTPGDGTVRARVVERAASLAGRASLLGLAVILAALYLWRVTGARPLADAIVRHLRRPLLPTFEPVGLVLAPILGPGALLAVTAIAARLGDHGVIVDRYGFAIAAFAGICSLIAATRMIDRRRALGAAADLVQQGSAPPPGREREGEIMALDAAVDPDAPCSRAPLTDRACAHWTVTTTRVFRAGNNHNSEPGPENRGPMIVPIRSGGRAALLDLTHAAVDLRAARARFTGRKLPSDLAHLVGGAPQRESIYLLEERALVPGEPLHVIGRVQRFHAAPGGAIPVIGGVPGDLAIVHAGSRRSLLRGLAIERGYLAGALVLCLGVATAVATLAGYLASR